RIAAEELRRNRVLVFVEVQVALGLPILGAQHAVGRGELGHDQSAAGEVTDKATENGVGDSGHGSQHCGWGNFDASEGKSRRDRPAVHATPGKWRRLVPILAHEVILTVHARESPRLGEGCDNSREVTSSRLRLW